jgi:hypothetical protein
MSTDGESNSEKRINITKKADKEYMLQLFYVSLHAKNVSMLQKINYLRQLRPYPNNISARLT